MAQPVTVEAFLDFLGDADVYTVLVPKSDQLTVKVGQKGIRRTIRIKFQPVTFLLHLVRDEAQTGPNLVTLVEQALLARQVQPDCRIEP